MHVSILHMSVITQDGDTALVRAARRGRTEAVKELVKAKANLDLQNNVRSPDVHVVTEYTVWTLFCS